MAASPVAPATPANAVLMAQIFVPGGSSSVTAPNITDKRPGGLPAISSAWSMPRGEQAYVAWPNPVAGVGTAQTDILTVPDFTAINNRIYVVEFYANNIQQNTATGFVKVYFTNASNAGLGQLLLDQTVPVGSRTSINPGKTRVACGAGGPPTQIPAGLITGYKIRAQTSVNTVDFNAGSAVDPGPLIVRVLDDGALAGTTGP